MVCSFMADSAGLCRRRAGRVIADHALPFTGRRILARAAPRGMVGVYPAAKGLRDGNPRLRVVHAALLAKQQMLSNQGGIGSDFFVCQISIGSTCSLILNPFSLDALAIHSKREF